MADDAVADLFYGHLFEIAPEVRPMFPEDMKEQKAMLGTAVTAAHYAPVGAALLWTLEKGLGPDFTPEVKAAWTETYAALAGVMTAA